MSKVRVVSVVFYAFIQLFLVEVAQCQARVSGNGTDFTSCSTRGNTTGASLIPIRCGSSVSPSVSPSPTATTSDADGATTVTLQPATPYTTNTATIQPTPVTPSVSQSVDPCSNAVNVFNNDAACITALTAADRGGICRGRCRTLANNVLSACDTSFISTSYLDACVGAGALALKGMGILILLLMAVFASVIVAQ